MNRQKLIEGDLKQSGGIVVRKTITFADAAGQGAVGTIDVFNVSGACKVKISAYCETDLAGATATIEFGVAGATDGIIAQATATDIVAGDFFADATPTVLEAGPGVFQVALDMKINVETAAVSAGKITFMCEYEPITPDAFVQAV